MRSSCSAGASRPRLRIAIAIEQVNRRGGQERVIAELAPRLARHHEVHLYCYGLEDVPLEGIQVHRVLGIPGTVGVRALWFVLASSLAIHPRRYDVVLSQGGNTLVQNFALAHTCQLDRRRVQREVEWQYRRPGPIGRTWITLRGSLFIALERRAARRCRGRLIAVSSFLKEYFLREYGLQDADVHVAANGVDHEVFRPATDNRLRKHLRGQFGLPQDAFIALFLSGRWFDKGLPFVLQSMPLMRSEGHLLVVGAGDVRFFADMARRLGVAERVAIHPEARTPEQYYHAADCLVLPTAAEAFGLVFAEAAACGLPIIATREGAALDLIEDGVSGFFVERDSADIAQKLDRVAADARLRESMGLEVHRRSLQFSWDRQAEEIERLFMRALEAGGQVGEAGVCE
jgi:glycosyltransferase involved in cell wall biosynthesis